MNGRPPWASSPLSSVSVFREPCDDENKRHHRAGADRLARIFAVVAPLRSLQAASQAARRQASGFPRYQLLPQGYSICLVFLKLFERVYAPLTAGLLSPVSADAKVPDQKRSQLDRLYHRVIDDLDALVEAVGLKAA